MTNLQAKLDALPEWLGAYTPPTRKRPLPYDVARANCISCGERVSGDWGLVPDECDRCLSEGLARHALRQVDAALAHLEVAREWIESQPHGDSPIGNFCGTKFGLDCTCGRDALLKKLEVPK
jgi:hypothetical protein